MLGKHLVFVAHEKEEKDGELRIVRPEIGGSSAEDLIKELDLMGYMQTVGKERVIFWTPQEKFYAKNTCNLPEAMKIPTIIDEQGHVTGRNDALTRIFDSYAKYLREQRKVSADYNSLIEGFADMIDMVCDTDSANQVVAQILNYEKEGKHIWDSRLRITTMLNDKCKSLGYKFNKLSNVYE